MSKQRRRQPAAVLPSPLEEHLGAVWDPRGHEEEIAQANKVLGSFFEDMNKGHVSQIDLEALSNAAEILGQFAGYPDDTHQMICMMDTSVGVASFRDISLAIPPYMAAMNTLIEARRAMLLEHSQRPAIASASPESAQDVPF